MVYVRGQRYLKIARLPTFIAVFFEKIIRGMDFLIKIRDSHQKPSPLFTLDHISLRLIAADADAAP